MASKRRLRRLEIRKACGDKIKFPNEVTAQAAAHSHQAKHGKWMNAYLCKHCGSWHIGHPPTKIRIAELKKQGKI